MKKMKMKKKNEKRFDLYFARDGHDVLVRTAGWYCTHSTVCHGYCSSCINQQWNSTRFPLRIQQRRCLHVCVYCTAIPVPGGGGGGSGRNKLILNTLKKN